VKTISGWGGNPKSVTNLVTADGPAQIAEAVASAPTDRGLIARGLGRSYGDAAQRAGGTTLVVRTGREPTWVDQSKGLLRASASASIGELIRFSDPDGYFIPVTPGTRHVTVGGAIAADIHGKDHHRAGSFGMHIESLRLLLAGGETVEVDRESDRDLFNATVGGMGLTGIILEADIRMIPVPGNRMLVDTFRTADLDVTMTALSASESTHRYSVAWVDLATQGLSMGRGVVTNANHTTSEGSAPLGETEVSVPSMWCFGIVNRPTVAAFNELWFRKAPGQSRRSAQSYDRFFYPLDMVGDWNRFYGRRGFLQYQFVLPFEAEARLPEISELLATSQFPVSFAVLKRFGEENDGFLSFPTPGWTLAVDIPISSSPHDLENLLRSLDEMIVDNGGRIYLAKDSRLRGDLLSAMYPELGSFLEVRERVDPNRRFQSDLSVRLGL